VKIVWDAQLARARRLADRIGTTASLFRRHDGGGLTAPLAIALPVLFGFGMLTVDAGRYFNLQTSIQGGADALALAAAAELDARPDSLVRANRAIDQLVNNDQRFGQGQGRLDRSAISVRFLRALPTSDGAPIPAANLTTDPLKASYVEVAIRPVTLNNLFAAAASVVSVSMQTNASAVAGFDSVACNVTPLFMCNPFEGSTTSLFVAARDPGFRLRQIAMKSKGSEYGSGIYGYLEPAYGNGGAAVKDALAVDKPKGCYRQNGVELQTGNIASTAEAMNVRFDIYDGSFSGKKGDVAYRPARNVRKGFTGASCNASAAYDPLKAPADPANFDKALGLPRDSCFYAGNCTFGGATMGGRIGDGEWNFQAYWDRTYGTAYPNGWSNANRPSRYEVYRHEIENDLTVNQTAQATTKEKGAPICYAGGPSTLDDEPDRRTFVGAIIDCQAAEAAGQLSGSSGGVIPVTAYARFFLTEPMDKLDGTIWAEMVDLVEPGTAAARNIIRDSVQLHR
jgi:Flp pilus assembly protein TadG